MTEKETVILRMQPLLKIFIDSKMLEVDDASEPSNSGIYNLKELKHIKLCPQQADRFISILSFVVDLVLGGTASGGTYKNKAHMKFKVNNQTKKIWLTNVEYSKAQKLTIKINKTIDARAT